MMGGYIMFHVFVKEPGKKLGHRYGEYDSYEEAYEAMDGPEYDWVPFGSLMEVVEGVSK